MSVSKQMSPLLAAFAASLLSLNCNGSRGPIDASFAEQPDGGPFYEDTFASEEWPETFVVPAPIDVSVPAATPDGEPECLAPNMVRTATPFCRVALGTNGSGVENGRPGNSVTLHSAEGELFFEVPGWPEAWMITHFRYETDGWVPFFVRPNGPGIYATSGDEHFLLDEVDGAPGVYAYDLETNALDLSLFIDPSVNHYPPFGSLYGVRNRGGDEPTVIVQSLTETSDSIGTQWWRTDDRWEEIAVTLDQPVHFITFDGDSGIVKVGRQLARLDGGEVYVEEMPTTHSYDHYVEAGEHRYAVSSVGVAHAVIGGTWTLLPNTSDTQVLHALNGTVYAATNASIREYDGPNLVREIPVVHPGCDPIQARIGRSTVVDGTGIAFIVAGEPSATNTCTEYVVLFDGEELQWL